MLRWCTLVHYYTVSKVGGHDKVVLDNEGSTLKVDDEAFDDLGCNDTLLGIEVGGGFVNKVDICRLTESKDDGYTLQFTTRQVCNFLVKNVLNGERLNDVSLELRVKESSLDLLEEQHADGALELGRDLLGLVRYVEFGYLFVTIGLQQACKQSDESGLASTVLTQHDNNFRISEFTSFNLEFEVAYTPCKH